MYKGSEVPTIQKRRLEGGVDIVYCVLCSVLCVEGKAGVFFEMREGGLDYRW